MRVFYIVLGVALSACSSTPDPVVVQDGCDPIVPEHCGFPFPNDFWRDPTGHVVFGANTLPVPSLGKPLDPKTFVAWRDGFSPGEMAMTFLPGATATGMADENHIPDSITTQSPTILMEADTGALVPHIAEIDMSTFATDDERAIMIHPVVRLKDGTRYIAAIRNVVDTTGVVIPPSAAFQALRDNRVTSYTALESRRAHFEDVFAKLATAGIDRKTLQLAWDYTTATQANTTGDLLAMRDDALATVGATGPTFTIDSVETAPNQYLAKRLHGTMTVPLYLNRDDPGDDEHIVRDAAASRCRTALVTTRSRCSSRPARPTRTPPRSSRTATAFSGFRAKAPMATSRRRVDNTTMSASPWTGSAWRTTTTRRSSTPSRST